MAESWEGTLFPLCLAFERIVSTPHSSVGPSVFLGSWVIQEAGPFKERDPTSYSGWQEGPWITNLKYKRDDGVSVTKNGSTGHKDII